MSQLALAHLSGSLYPERQARRESGLDRWVRVVIGLGASWMSPWKKRAWSTVDDAIQCEPRVRACSDEQLREQMAKLAQSSYANGTQRGLTLALVREACRRCLQVTPFETQLMGAICLLDGRLAEMQTGEGKTLTAGIAATIAGCAGTPVHVITVNDYLAQRDVDELRPLFEFFGLTSSAIVSGMSRQARQRAYRCHIAYCTGKELVFDYLKDRAAAGPDRNQARRRLQAWLDESEDPGPLLRGLYFAIVDETDSVLIDEARTPLILAEKVKASIDGDVLKTALELARCLKIKEDFEFQPGARDLYLRPLGRQRMTEQSSAAGSEWASRKAREHWTLQALRALHLYRRDEHYIIKDGKVQIVDENTGRVLPGRVWEQGLQQLIEIKEGCACSDQTRTLARITYQRFFARYLRLAGMTGTAREVGRELWAIYRLPTVGIRTHRPCIRTVLPVTCAPDSDVKWLSIARRARQLALEGRPVLIGTRSVGASEALSAVLSTMSVEHRILNARQDAQEAQLVKEAGMPGRITVATNMAGRGTDIKLPDDVIVRGGLHVILSEYHDSRRIDRQLFGRAARQGDPGSAEAIVSLQDSVFVDHAPLLLLRFAEWTHDRLPGARGIITSVLRRFSQAAAESRHANVRSEAIRQDEQFESRLSYAGRN